MNLPVQIQPATADQAERVRRLFRLEPTELPTHTLVALVGPRRTILGHATLVPRTHRGADPANGDEAFLMIQTLGDNEPLRDRLLESAIVTARQARLSAISSVGSFAAEDPTAAAFSRAGFRPAETLCEASIPLGPAVARAAAVLARARQCGQIPASVTFEGLRSRRVPEIRRLVHVMQLMDVSKFDAALAGRGERPFTPECCAIVADGLEILGIQLASRTANDLFVPCRWVRPDARGSWVNAAIMATSGERSELSPESRVRFSYHAEIHPETVRFLRRMGGEIVSQRLRFRNMLAS